VHPYPQPVNGHVPAIFYAAPVVLAALAILIYRFRASRDLVFGTLFFLTTISVVLQIVPATQSFLAERYTYLPYMGLMFVAARLFVKAWESAAFSRASAPLARIVGVTALAGCAVACAGLTYQRSKVWHDSLTLWTDAIAHEPQAATAYHNLAEAKTQAGIDDDVIRLYTMAIAYNPRHYKAYIDRGNAKLRLRDYEGALADYRDALRIQPGEGIAHFDAGVAAYYAGRVREACEDWRTAIVEGYPAAETDIDRYCQ
jgi:tetratricopeptide (TPR) repeat protein